MAFFCVELVGGLHCINRLRRVTFQKPTIEIKKPQLDLGIAWSSGNTAYGFHTGSSNGSDAIFMAQNFANVMGLCVLHGVANTPAPEITASLSASFATLSWNLSGHCGYEIHRSQEPYFTASDATKALTVGQTNAIFSTNLGVGDPDRNYYYNVNVVTGSPAQSSITVGVFDFSLTPGS